MVFCGVLGVQLNDQVQEFGHLRVVLDNVDDYVMALDNSNCRLQEFVRNQHVKQ